jgi:hypothetical protein
MSIESLALPLLQSNGQQVITEAVQAHIHCQKHANKPAKPGKANVQKGAQQSQSKSTSSLLTPL